MSARVSSRSSITKPPSSIRLWAMNWPHELGQRRARPGHPAVALQEPPLALARQQRLAIVQLHHELDPAAERLDRIEQEEAVAAEPGGQRRAAKDVGDQAGQPRGQLLGEPERHPQPRVDRAAERDQRAQPVVAAVGGRLVAEHPALGVAAQVHVAAGGLADAVDGVRDGQHVIGERALQPALLALGGAEVDHPRIDAVLVQEGDGAGGGRDVVDLGGQHHRRARAAPRGGRGPVRRWRRGSSGAAGRRGARRRPRRARAPRRWPGRRSAPPRGRSGRPRRAGRSAG